MTTDRTPLRAVLIGTAGVTAAVTLAACSSSGSSPAAGNSKPPAQSPASQSPASQAASGAPTGGTSVTATETEFHIALSSTSLKPGTVTFRVKNAGSITHALTVDGPGVDDKSTSDISPGSSATLTVTLKAGKYDVFCPVGNHKMEGMDETVQVG